MDNKGFIDGDVGSGNNDVTSVEERQMPRL